MQALGCCDSCAMGQCLRKPTLLEQNDNTEASTTPVGRSSSSVGLSIAALFTLTSCVDDTSNRTLPQRFVDTYCLSSNPKRLCAEMLSVTGRLFGESGEAVRFK